MAVDLSKLLTQLQQANLQKTNAPLFQLLSQLIKFSRDVQVQLNTKITQNASDLSSLASKTFLTQADEHIDLASSRQELAGSGITFDDSVANERTVNNDLIAEAYLTHNTSAKLTNYRRLLAGTSIAFDDSVAGQRTVNSTLSIGDWSVLTNGNPAAPELIWDSKGDVITTYNP